MVETMGSRIRELRILRGLTQEELAYRCYRKKNTISQYENDEVDIRASVIEQLAKVLYVQPGYFFGQPDNGIEAEKGARDALKNIRDHRFKRAAYEHLRIVGNTERQFIPGKW